jgi:hypothetical protein
MRVLPLLNILLTDSTSRFPWTFFGYIYKYPLPLSLFSLAFGDPMFPHIYHICLSFSLSLGIIASELKDFHECEVSDFWGRPRLYTRPRLYLAL